MATNSKGHIFVYTRTGAPNATVGDVADVLQSRGSKLFEFDQSGKYIREIGVRISTASTSRRPPVWIAQDNVWLVDQGSSNVIKFDAEGRLQLVLSRKPEAISVRPPGAGAGAGTTA